MRRAALWLIMILACHSSYAQAVKIPIIKSPPLASTPQVILQQQQNILQQQQIILQQQKIIMRQQVRLQQQIRLQQVQRQQTPAEMFPPAAKVDREADKGDAPESAMYCYVVNPTQRARHFYISADNENWQQETVNPNDTIPIRITQAIHLRIWNTSSKSFYKIMGYESHYYKIVYSYGFKKWIFTE